MPHRSKSISRASIVALLLVGLGTVGAKAQSAPVLFDDDAPLALIIEAPLRQLSANVRERPEIPGTLRYSDAEGREIVLDIELRVRGKSRLELCDFPPLRVDFKRSQLDGTVFAEQDHLKLVTLCKRQSAYRDYVAVEHQIYKAYNALTDLSFRVRWASIEYIDTGARRPTSFTEAGYFIEEDWEVAARNGLQVLEVDSLEVSQLDPRSAAQLALFHFMVGNTDWSPIRPAPDESCCHNGKPLISEDGVVIVLPYDFDQSGVINTEYSAPRSHLGIRSVRERVYRGFCATNDEIDWAVERFNEQRAEIERAFDSRLVSDGKKTGALRYLAGFYEIINDPKEKQRQILSRCRE